MNLHSCASRFSILQAPVSSCNRHESFLPEVKAHTAPQFYRHRLAVDRSRLERPLRYRFDRLFIQSRPKGLGNVHVVRSAVDADDKIQTNVAFHFLFPPLVGIVRRGWLTGTG